MLRIVDANLNRIGEGLRVLEDLSRFILDDSQLCEQFKLLRHELLPKDASFQGRLMAERRAGEDAGAFLDVSGEAQRPDVVSLANANSRRIQESLRVLEEIAKVEPIHLDWETIKRARFEAYEITQELTLRLQRRQGSRKIHGLYLILDFEALQGRDEVKVGEEAIEGGVRVIQLRDKVRSKRALLEVAGKLRKLCADKDIVFLVNDYFDVALASDADGLHLGQEDLPAADARRLLPANKLLGYSTATLEEALEAERAGADYIAVGSIFPSPSKSGTRIAGIETLRRVREKVSIPLVAIGGIDENNISSVARAGANAVAVISAVLAGTDIRGASQKLARRLKEA